jgi:hypothetical protein
MVKRDRINTLPARGARINIRAEKNLRDDLARLAKDDGRSLSAYVERVLAAHVETHRTESSRSAKKTGR